METAYERSSRYSKCKLDKLRERLRRLPLGDAAVLVCGSYARREASRHSDIDFFVIPGDTDGDQPPIEEIRSEIRTIVPNEPSKDGAFSEKVNHEQILDNIGGDSDSNQNITRRILLLLEGEWLFNEPAFLCFRREILEKYIQEDMTDHQLALFLLNDIIRYYRTVAVDYEFKTSDNESSKPWAIRNIKLVFSRKLLYASDLFSVAMTVDCERDKKIEILESLFKLPVMERMIYICGNEKMKPVLASYNRFLSVLEDSDHRIHLDTLEKSESGRKDPCFRHIKNEGHHFTIELLKVFEGTFDSTHPIRRAVVF